MDAEDAREFLRFMTSRQLSIASILNLFFQEDDKTNDDDSKQPPVPSDWFSSSELDSDDTIEQHTLSYLRTRITQWLTTTGRALLAKVFKNKHELILLVVLARLEKEGRRGGNKEYLRGPAASKTTIADLQEFDPERSAHLIRDDLPCTFAVLRAIAGDPDPLEHNSNDDEHDRHEEEIDIPDIDQSFDPTQTASTQGVSGRPKVIRRFGRRSKRVVVIAVAHMLLFARNDRCNRWPLQLAVDLLGARVPRRSMELLSRLGVVASYASADRVFRNMAEDDKQRAIRLVALPETTFSVSYDNVNWLQGVRDPRLEKSSQIMAAVAACGYVHNKEAQYDADQPLCSPELYKRTLGINVPRPSTTAAMPMSPVAGGKSEGQLRAPRDQLKILPATKQLSPDKYLPGRLEEEHMAQVMLAHALRAWVGLHPKSGIKISEIELPPQVLPLLPSNSQLLGLPVLNLDEGSVAGNIAVVEQYMKFLEINTEDFCREKVLPVVADAFTIAHLRSAMARRALDTSTSPSFDQMQFLQPWAALFHLQYTFQKAFLDAHGGSVTHQSAVSARILCDKIGLKGLCSGNTDFHKVDVYIKTLFAAFIERILTPAIRIELKIPESTTDDATAFAELDALTLAKIARAALQPFTQGSAETIALDHGEREQADLLYLHGRAMLMDALIYIELRDSVKSGDLGRTLIATKCALPKFAATGHTRYCQEVLELHHQIHSEMPPALVTTMLSASIVNHAGKTDTWLAADLDIEHQVRELKNAFRVTASSDVVRNGHIGQITTVLREMRMRWYRAFGVSSIGGEHTARPIDRGVATLAEHLKRSDVFTWKTSRLCKSFELSYGEEVQRRKASGDKNIRQPKNLTTDTNEYGMIKLQTLMRDWMLRQSRDAGQTKVALPPADADEGEAEWHFTDEDIEALMGGFELLGEDG